MGIFKAWHLVKHRDNFTFTFTSYSRHASFESRPRDWLTDWLIGAWGVRICSYVFTVSRPDQVGRLTLQINLERCKWYLRTVSEPIDRLQKPSRCVWVKMSWATKFPVLRLHDLYNLWHFSPGIHKKTTDLPKSNTKKYLNLIHNIITKRRCVMVSIRASYFRDS